MGSSTPVLGTQASFEEYLALPDDLRAEYVDGAILMNPPPSFRHQMICLRLRDLLVSALPDAIVVVSAGWQMGSGNPRVRIPDLAVLAAEPLENLITEAPVVAVEVLSTNRSDDLVRKSAEYLEAGVGQYWIVDPRDGVVDVFANAGHRWEPLAQLTRENPTGTVAVAGFGSVRLSLADLLPG